MSKSRSSFSLIFTGLMFAAGCYAGDGRLLEPGDSSSQPGDVKKQGLTLTVVTDSALAAALGWESNVVAGAEVILQRGPDPGDRDTVASDENGVVKLESLVPGDYKVWGSYRPSSGELEHAGTAGFNVAILGTGFKTRVPSATGMQLFADEPGSLVISEYEWSAKTVPGVGSYFYGGYLELYNNSDSTVYLDGKIVGAAWPTSYDYEVLPCADMELRSDPLGVWTRYFAAFPGSGQEHAAEPGEVVVVALDAIDHTVVHPGTVDLSGADFEFFEDADVDNPVVPNMISLSLGSYPLGHGLGFQSLSPVVFIAEAVSPATLPRKRDPRNGQEYVRIPASSVLDVLALRQDYNFSSLYNRPECATAVHTRFDRLEGHLMYSADEADWNLAVHRRTVMGDPGTVLLLQRTRTTALDFFVAPRSPGTVAAAPITR